ncbi:MAG: hypothetical protein ACR2NA_14220 [Solirubrobacterales bacterium]
MPSLDGLTRRLGDRLAERHTRRRFIAGAGAGAAGLVVVGYAGPFAPTALTPENSIVRCGFSRREINVCYSPMRVERSEPGLPKGASGVAVRKGPEPDAPIIQVEGTPVIVPEGRIFGRQSDRDGGVENKCPDPGPRPAVNGFVFGYPEPGAGVALKGGWAATGYDGQTFLRDDPTWDGRLCGPAFLDFDCRAGDDPTSPFKTTCGRLIDRDDPERGREGYTCGGDDTAPAQCGPPDVLEVVVVRDPKGRGVDDSTSFERYNLKYEADGTTTHWLVPGDRVREFCRKCVRSERSEFCPERLIDDTLRTGCCHFYSCVEVLDAKYVPRGTRGWTETTILQTPGGTPASLAS